MTADNLEQALRLFCRRRPFRPFLVEFTSGERIEVRHPEAVGRFFDLFVFRAPSRRHQVFDASCVARLIEPED